MGFIRRVPSCARRVSASTCDSCAPSLRHSVCWRSGSERTQKNINKNRKTEKQELEDPLDLFKKEEEPKEDPQKPKEENPTGPDGDDVPMPKHFTRAQKKARPASRPPTLENPPLQDIPTFGQVTKYYVPFPFGIKMPKVDLWCTMRPRMEDKFTHTYEWDNPMVKDPRLQTYRNRWVNAIPEDHMGADKGSCRWRPRGNPGRRSFD